MENMRWTLIVVTKEGLVSSSTYESKRACEDAQSIALYGMTIEEQKVADENEKRKVEEWYKANPPREPKTDFEKNLTGSITSCYGYRNQSLTKLKNGLIQDGYPYSVYILPDSNIKYAKCVLA